MGVGNISQVLRVPGRLCINPTNLATAWPHGGTGLGSSSQVNLIPAFRVANVVAEEFGGETAEAIFIGESWVLSAVLREWADDDVLTNVFLNVSGAGGAKIVDVPGTNRAGYKLSDKSYKLLFTPRDQTNHPAAYMPKAMPMLEETAKLSLSIADDLALPVMFLALRDGSDRAVKMGKLGDLTL